MVTPFAGEGELDALPKRKQPYPGGRIRLHSVGFCSFLKLGNITHGEG